MLTIFAIPKSFDGIDDLHQRNAINSWKQIVDGRDILLVGDGSIQKTAEDLGVGFVGGVKKNRQGTPLISSAFQLARAHSKTPVLVYANCDMIMFEEIRGAIELLRDQSDFPNYLATTRRINLKVDQLVDFSNPSAVEELRRATLQRGVIESLVCKDIMIFPRDLYHSIPDFSVGRGNWDNWMVQRAKTLGATIVRMTKDIPTVHQAHSYNSGDISSRGSCYVTSEEARENQRLGGGRHLINGSTCDYFLDNRGFTPSRWKWLHGEFWRDFPRFAGLLMQLSGWKRGI